MAPGLATMRAIGLRGKVALLGLLCLALAIGVAVREWQHGASAWVALAGAVACVLIAYLLLAFYLQTARSLADFQAAVVAMKEGDLSQRVQLSGQDEFAAIGNALDAMNANLSALVADIRSESTLVSQAGESLAAGTSELSSRTERQAASLEETSASVLQLSSTVRQNVEDAKAVERLASQVHGIAESGGGRMREAIDSMRAINESATKVHHITGVIDSIAFQTNILALNAAVEAARAGDQGRGFAVVAAEVRALALRSAGAAQEIKALISASSAQVESGVSRIDQVGAMLEQVVKGIGEVAGNVRSITAATTEQSVGLTQITQAIAGLDDITQKNSQMVEQASTSSADLGDRARRLAKTVGGFRLRQGTADEAQALVRRAVTLFKRAGQGSLAQITDAANGYADRDMYVFAWDRQLVYHAFAGKPVNVGKRADQILGTDVTQLAHDVWAAAAAGGGWVDYAFLNPTNGQVAPKTSYVVPVSDTLVLGCGVYKTVSRG